MVSPIAAKGLTVAPDYNDRSGGRANKAIFIMKRAGLLDDLEIFSHARSLESLEERSDYLDRECGDDIDLRASVERLLQSLNSAGNFLESPASIFAVADIDPDETACSSDSIATESSAPMPEVRDGILGDYRILREIGRGGMGVVYEAQQISLGRIVALKVLPFARMLDRTQLARFKNEARAAASLSHPHLVHVHAVGEDRGVHYYAMQYIEGQTVADLIASARPSSSVPVRSGSGKEASAYTDVPTQVVESSKPSSSMSNEALRETLRDQSPSAVTLKSADEQRRIRSVVELAIQAADALEHAHKMGVVHRDIKPSNLLVDSEGHLWIADFGLALIETDHNLSVTGSMMGTLRYMSPEQMRGDRHVLDHRTDIYSLGATLYEMLVQRPAFADSDVTKLMHSVQDQEPVAPTKLNRAIPLDLQTIVSTAMSKEPDGRYDSAAAFAADLKFFLDDQPIKAKPPGVIDLGRKWMRRHRPLIATACSILMVAIIGAGVLLGRERSATLHALATAEAERETADGERVKALDAQALAVRQEELAKQMEQLAKRQRDAAENDSYIANVRLAHNQWASQHSAFEALSAGIPQPGRPDLRSWEWYFLQSVTNPQRKEFPFQSLGFSPDDWHPDGIHLATRDDTGLINILNTQTGKILRSHSGTHGYNVTLAWSPDGQQLAAALRNQQIDLNVILLWDFETGELVKELRGHPSHYIDWHPDSVRLAVGGVDGTIRVIDTVSEQESRSWQVTESVVALDWHPDGVHLVAGFGPRGHFEVKVWDSLRDDEVLHHRLYHGKHAILRPDGKQLAFTSTNSLSIEDFPSGKQAGDFKSWVESLAWNADGRQIAAATEGGGLKIWDVESMDRRSAHVHKTVWGGQVSWSPTRNMLATSGDGALKVFSAAEIGGSVPSLRTTESRVVQFSPDGHRLLAGTAAGKFGVWNAESWVTERTLLQKYRVATFSPNGAQIAGENEQGVIVDSGDRNRLLITDEDGEVTDIAWSPDGTKLAVTFVSRQAGKYVSRLQLFDAVTGGPLGSDAPLGENQAASVAWSPDGLRIAGGGPSLIRVWDASLQNEQVILDEESRAPCTDVCWSPDGEFLAACFGSGRVVVYDSLEWRVVHSMKGHMGFALSVAWNPQFARLASGGRDGRAIIWDSISGREIISLDAHDGRVWNVAWSPDGLRLATCGDDGYSRIWDGSRAFQRQQRHGDLRQKANLLAQSEQFNDAAEVVDELIEIYPGETDLVVLRQRLQWRHAMHLAVSGGLSEAKGTFTQLSNQSADVPDYRLQLPAALLRDGQPERALEYAEKLVAESPDNPRYRDELVRLYQRRALDLCQSRQFAEAFTVLEKLGKRFPVRSDARGQLVYLMAKEGLFNETFVMLEGLSDETADRTDYRPTLAKRLTSAGDYESSMRVIDALLHDFPDSNEYQVQRQIVAALSASSANRLDEAIEMIDKLDAEQLDRATRRRLAEVYLSRARSRLAADQFADAIDDLSKAVPDLLRQDKVIVLHWLALAQLGNEQVDDYRSTCLRMVELFGDAESTSDSAWLAWTCALTGAAIEDYSIPVASAEKSINADGESVFNLNALGAILFRSGQYERAREVLARADDLSQRAEHTSSTYTSFFLAMTYEGLGDPDRAERWLSKAMEQAQHEGDEQDLSWNRRLTLEILQDEAKQLIQASSSEKNPIPAE